jgi:4-hydroxy-tetrahydrodipicolinate reductase
MGRLIERLAPDSGCEVAAIVTSANAGTLAERARQADVAVDFSTAAAFVANFPVLAAAGLNVVVGTTGWQRDETWIRDLARESGLGMIAATNFSPGVALFQATVERAAALLAPRADVGAWIHEAHHAAKRDAPSGTALTLRAAMTAAGYARPIDVSSTRAGSIPGTHTVGFDGPFETITLTHTTRDRATFARGALEAARWLEGRQGWFTFRDVLGLE